MDLKRDILRGLDVGQARWFADVFHLPCPPNTDRGALIDVLDRAAHVTPEALLEPLYESDVKALCRRVGLPSTGRRAVLVARLLESVSPSGHSGGLSFTAIDFETADTRADSACAVALVRVDGGEITRRVVRLIRPPRPSFVFTHIHGLTWEDVRDQPTFADIWPTLVDLLDGAAFLAAHNAPFDRNVLHACCRDAAVPVPLQPFRCTVRIARQAWNLRPTRLPNVCAHLGIPLKHHDPSSDAEACARIVLAAGAHLALPCHGPREGKPAARP